MIPTQAERAKLPYDVILEGREKNASPRWQLYWYCQMARRYKTKSLKTADEIEAWRRAPAIWHGMQGMAGATGELSADTLTWQALFERRMMVLEGQKKDTRGKRKTWRLYLAPTLAKLRVVDATNDSLEQLFERIRLRTAPLDPSKKHLLRREGNGKLAPLGNTTMYRIQSLVIGMLKLARKRWVPNAPMEFERYERDPPNLKKFITREATEHVMTELEKLSAGKAELDPLHLYGWLLCVTGQRKTCVVQTRTAWVDPERRSGFHLLWGNHRPSDNPKSPKKYLNTIVHPSNARLADFLALLARAKREAGTREYLFPNGTRGENTLSERFQTFLRKIGYPDVTSHWLRHSYATNNIVDGTMSIGEVATMTGTDEATLKRYYDGSTHGDRLRLIEERYAQRKAEEAALRGDGGAAVLPFKRRS